ncbi:hypothetical protein CY652_00525 [Burkholderia sp. WAC0059]|uniref:hypothetical protein n=1 Tax=Burkholderia sp. WAC0059 TaxID=2066022 RepID=UPI000C7EA6A3|nr:hypothetical protein [Burkholderia sp. WAC0059]PLZ04203.1 hypothetical protein CY652_00525 [Burkholderia sp. WAC0059]
MKKLAVPLLFIPLALGACAWFQKNPDASRLVIDKTTSRSVNDVIACLTVEASKHDTSFSTSAATQGATMLQFSDSTVILLRAAGSGTTSYRVFAAGHPSSASWIGSSSETCAP